MGVVPLSFQSSVVGVFTRPAVRFPVIINFDLKMDFSGWIMFDEDFW